MDNEHLGTIIGRIGRHLEEADRAREKALSVHRQAIRESSLAIRAVHRREFETARGHLEEARRALDRGASTLEPHPEIYYAGFLQDAEKEYAEASVTYDLVTAGRFPEPEDLRVGYPPYLNGLAEAVGELRRHILDQMRRGEAEESEATLEVMDDIYYVLTTMDFPEAITRGLRRSTDVARGCLEKTRGELTTHFGHLHLEKTMEALRAHLGGPEAEAIGWRPG